MGAIVEYRKLAEEQAVYRLLIYSRAFSKMDTDAISVNKSIAAELINIKPNRRSMHLEKCFVKVLETLPERPVVKDIDVMFNPEYQVDVLKLLISAYKQRNYSLIWPGTYSEGKLIYSEEGFSDYRVYEIKDYDILCVI